MGHWGRENGPYQISFPIGTMSDATYFQFYRPGRQGRVIARAAPLSELRQIFRNRLDRLGSNLALGERHDLVECHVLDHS